MNAIVPCLAVAAVVSVASGCATTPYSQIDGYRYTKTSLDTHPVIISRIDGRSTTPRATPVRVDPGPHEVVVQTYPSTVDRLGHETTIRLDVKPCTHYYLVAVKPNRLAREFDVKVDYEEPVPGCSAPEAAR